MKRIKILLRSAGVLGIVGFTSCARFDAAAPVPFLPAGSYAGAMQALRSYQTKRGIPRSRIFYQFQLDGMKSAKSMGDFARRGIYLGYAESWDLSGGWTLRCVKMDDSHPVKLRPLKPEEMPTWPLPERDYHELQPEPFFNTIDLIDPKGRFVDSVQ